MDEGVRVEIVVQDEAGLPIPTAAIVFPAEGARHGVASETGSWMGSVLYLPDGTELSFTRGMSLGFEVIAPGWRLHEGIHRVTRGRRDRVTVTLAPLAVDVRDAPPPAGDAVAALARWQDAAETWAAEPEDEPARRSMVAAREATAHYAEQWLAWVDAEGGARAPAEEICRLASRAPERCRG